MTPKEQTWHIKQIQALYKSWKVSAEQAREIFLFQRNQNLLSNFWESMDFEFDNFQRILTPEQWPLYLVEYKENMARHEEYLRAEEERAAADLPWVQDELRFYREEYLPGLYQTPGLFPFVHSEPNKTEYLLAEAQKMLLGSKQKLLRQHYHTYHRLAPHALQVALLRHELQTLLLPLRDVERAADKPTRAVLKHMLNSANIPWYWRHATKVQEMNAQAVTFQREAFKARHGKSIEEATSTIVATTQSEEERQRQLIWQLLWLNAGWREFEQRRPARKKK
jgi:hypothetical protein